MYRLDYTYKNYQTKHVSKQTFFFEKKEDALKLIASGRAVDDLMDHLCDENYGYHKIKYLGGFSEEDRKNRLVALDKSDTFHVTSVYELYEEEKKVPLSWDDVKPFQIPVMEWYESSKETNINLRIRDVVRKVDEIQETLKQTSIREDLQEERD